MPALPRAGRADSRGCRLHRASDRVGDAFELGVGDHEWRPEQDRVAIDPVRVAGSRVDEDARVARRADDGLGQPGCARERAARLAILDQLEADHEAAPADGITPEAATNPNGQ